MKTWGFAALAGVMVVIFSPLTPWYRMGASVIYGTDILVWNQYSTGLIVVITLCVFQSLLAAVGLFDKVSGVQYSDQVVGMFSGFMLLAVHLYLTQFALRTSGGIDVGYGLYISMAGDVLIIAPFVISVLAERRRALKKEKLTSGTEPLTAISEQRQMQGTTSAPS